MIIFGRRVVSNRAYQEQGRGMGLRSDAALQSESSLDDAGPSDRPDYEVNHLPDDEVSDAPVVELRLKLVFKLSDVLAAEDTGENTRLGADLGREAARELLPVQGLEPWLKPLPVLLLRP